MKTNTFLTVLIVGVALTWSQSLLFGAVALAACLTLDFITSK